MVTTSAIIVGALATKADARSDAAARRVCCRPDARAARRRGRRAARAATARGCCCSSAPAGWNEAQRASVLSDLQHTLAGQGIAACSADAHPAAAPLATLAVELSPDDTAKATVDIEVRDAVTRKRVRRDVDLSRIPDDGRAAAIAIEADELLRASWAEIALDTARARRGAGRRPDRRSSAASSRCWRRRGPRAAAAWARAPRSSTTSAASTLVGADGVGRLRLSPRIELEIAGALRLGPSVTAPHGQVSALGGGRRPGAAVPDRGRPARVAGGGRRRRRRAGSSSAPSRRPTPRGRRTRNLLAVARLRLVGRLALGRSLHAHRRAGRRRRAARRGGDRRRRGGRARARRGRWARRSDWRRREPRTAASGGRHWRSPRSR